jgi:hypothetical protein
MVVEEHEEPLMQLVVLSKLGPSAPELHLAAPIIVHLHLIWSSAFRLFTEDSFPELAPVHEFCELQWNTLLLTALSTSDTEKRVNLDRRRRRGAGAAAADALGLFLLPKGRPGNRFADADEEDTREASFGLFFTAAGTAASPFLH